MAKQAYTIPKTNANAQMSVSFFLMWAVNALIIFGANLLFPINIALGTMSISPMAAVILSSGILAWLVTITLPLFTEVEIRRQMILAPHHWLAGYLVINAVGVWVITRFADIIGLGVASWIYVLGLALILDIAQGLSMMTYGELKK